MAAQTPVAVTGRVVTGARMVPVTGAVPTLRPELAFDPTSDRPALSSADDAGLPRLPSFSLRFRF